MLGFYAVECGNILGLGGAFYAALCAATVLSKEEKDKTAEFLLTHPVSRVKIITEKLSSKIHTKNIGFLTPFAYLYQRFESTY